MNERDLTRLEKLNERYCPNMTGFKLVDARTDSQTVLSHIETDLMILSSCDAEIKHPYRVLVHKDCIDICTVDNGTPMSYLFLSEAEFTPQDLREDVKKLCDRFDVRLRDMR